MKKKHEEGYALVFVLVVMIVLCTVALSLMGIALRNMHAQTSSIERMQDKYKAQGEIEVVVSKLENATEIPRNGIINFISSITGIAEGNITYANSGGTGDEGTITSLEATLKLVSKKGSAQIQCEIIWTVELDEKDDATYNIKSSKVEYKSYQISTVLEGGDGV